MSQDSPVVTVAEWTDPVGRKLRIVSKPVGPSSRWEIVVERKSIETATWEPVNTYRCRDSPAFITP